MSVIRRTERVGLSICVSAVVIVAGLSCVTAPAQAAYELPEGERITHAPVVPRAIPQKEEYELYDPKIGKNFDITKFWMRADLRIVEFVFFLLRNRAGTTGTWVIRSPSINSYSACAGTITNDIPAAITATLNNRTGPPIPSV